MESESDQPEKKKRRVTKACDQCRKRRIKCASYPNAALDAPCVICTEADQAAACTYTRPTRKRGPQPGKSKSLQEKCDALERLLGHLLVTIPAVTPHIEAFFRSYAADSPSSASPASASSSSAPLTTFEQQHNAYQTSQIAQQIESIVVPPLNPAQLSSGPRESSKRDSKIEAAESPGLSSNRSFPTPPAFRGSNIQSQPHHNSTLAQPTPSVSQRQNGSQRSSYSFSTNASFASNPFDLSTDGLQALAHVAVPDHEQAMEGVVGNMLPLSTLVPRGEDTGVAHKRLEIPLLPSESIRNQLLDLYFNQVVQPYFPMLDKTLFLRWSAHLPAVPTRTTTSLPSSRLISPTLYLAVFALASSYLPPAVSVSTHPSSIWAEAARSHLWAELDKNPNLETIQAAIIGSILDWGTGELNRAWIVSSVALALCINLSLHVSSSSQPDPNSLRLKTFHSALIVHTLISLRLSRIPLINLDDYNVQIPPIDGNEDFELWRSDKTPVELREDWKRPVDPTVPSIDSPQLTTTPLSPVRAPQAVRSASLSTFARMASLCAIGLAILRWDVSPRKGYRNSLTSGEQERLELVDKLRGWGDDLENELRLGGDKGGGVERLEERARWTVEMHLVLSTLNLRLRPHPSFASTAFDPVPSALILLHHILIRYRALYTMYRCLPTIDFSLHMLSATLFEQSDYAPHQHDAPLKAYEEMSSLFTFSKTSLDALRSKVDGHKRELGLLRGVHPSGSSVPPPSFSVPAPVALSEPFQAFLSYSADLGPAANAQTVLDFGSWDQTDLLFSLGLVGNPAESMNGWGIPTPGETRDGLPVPPVIEADFTSIDDSLAYAQTDNGRDGQGSNAPDAAMSMPNQPEANLASENTFSSSEGNPPKLPSFPYQGASVSQHFDASVLNAMHQALPHYYPPSSTQPPASYPSAQFFAESTNPGYSQEAGEDTDELRSSEERSTDLLTRWLSRGAVSLEGFDGIKSQPEVG